MHFQRETLALETYFVGGAAGAARFGHVSHLAIAAASMVWKSGPLGFIVALPTAIAPLSASSVRLMHPQHAAAFSRTPPCWTAVSVHDLSNSFVKLYVNSSPKPFSKPCLHPCANESHEASRSRANIRSARMPLIISDARGLTM